MYTLFYATIVDEVLQEIDVLLDHYIYQGYSAVVDYLDKPLGILITLYITLMGYAIVGGWMKLSMSTFIHRLVNIGLIYLFAMNWDWFSEYIVSFFFNVSSELSNVIATATPLPLPTISGDGMDGAMQSILVEMWDIGQWIWDTGSIGNIGAYLGAAVVWLSGGILVGYALFEIVMAKCMLSILLMLAPVFIIFTLFKSTQDYFNHWLGSCFGYGFLMLFISATIALSMSIEQWSLGDAYVSKALQINFLQILPIALMSFICIGLLKRSALIALGIGTSVAMFSRNQYLGSGVAKMISSGLSPPLKLFYHAGKQSGYAAKSDNVSRQTQQSEQIKTSLQRRNDE